jgi:hypothetical protein
MGRTVLVLEKPIYIHSFATRVTTFLLNLSFFTISKEAQRQDILFFPQTS